MRRLDQGKSEIAKLAFVVGELELRGAERDARCGLEPEPAMHVVAAEILAGAAEIAAAAGAERAAASSDRQGRRPDTGSAETSPA